MTAATHGNYRTIYPGKAPDQILQILTLDGGWLTDDGLHADLPHIDINTIRRALARLFNLGLLTKRTKELNGRGRWGKAPCYVEYKAVRNPLDNPYCMVQ